MNRRVYIRSATGGVILLLCGSPSHREEWSSPGTSWGKPSLTPGNLFPGYLPGVRPCPGKLDSSPDSSPNASGEGSPGKEVRGTSRHAEIFPGLPILNRAILYRLGCSVNIVFFHDQSGRSIAFVAEAAQG
jgi:hypothetical protein